MDGQEITTYAFLNASMVGISSGTLTPSARVGDEERTLEAKLERGARR